MNNDLIFKKLEEIKTELNALGTSIRVDSDFEADELLKRYKPAGSEKEESLNNLKDEVLKCTACALHKTRTNVVFGEGNTNARIMFIGEAPGKNEDLQGKPFVGAAGKLLSKIIEAMGLSREDIYIANVVKCRPPGNRDPLPKEIAACENRLLQQIAIIKPEVICTLGKFATQTILGEKLPIFKLHGQWHKYHDIDVMPTLHPAACLYNPSNKRVVWEDVQKIMKRLGLKKE